MRLVAPEERLRARAGVVTELEKCEPAVTDFLAEHADGAVLAQKRLQRILGILPDPVHHRVAAQPAGAAEIAGGVELRQTDAADLVGDRHLVGERIVDDGRVGPNHELVVVVGVRLVELARDFHGVQLRLLGEALADGATTAARRAGGAEVDRYELARPSRRDADDRLGERHRPELHLDGAVGQQRELRVRRPRGIEATHAAPGHGVLIGGGVAEDTAGAGARIEVGEERRDARRSGQQPGDVAVGAGAIFLLEGDIAVGVDERGRLRLSEKGKPEGDVQRHAVVVGEREAVAKSRAESAVDAAHIVATAAVPGEAQSQVAQVVGVWRLDEVAFVLHDGYLADVNRVTPGRRRIGAAAARAGGVEPQGVEQAPARVAVDAFRFPDGQAGGGSRRRLDVPAVGLSGGSGADFLRAGTTAGRRGWSAAGPA